MRVAFIGKSHEFSLAPLRALAERHRLVAVIESAPRKAQLPAQPRRRKSILRRVTASLRRDSGLEACARRLRVPYLYAEPATKQALASLLGGVETEIICVASMSFLLRRDALAAAKHGALNLHPSLLPLYYGPFPWFWQYHDFVREWGVTVHALDEGEDTGPIVKQAHFDLALGTDVSEAMRIAGQLGGRLMAEAVDEIEAGRARFTPQPPHDSPKARVVRPEERFIDWDVWPIERVWHFMRGTYPWVDAVEYPAEIRGRCRIGEIERESCGEAAGRLHRDARGLFVSHREGKIRIRVGGTGFLGAIGRVLGSG